MSPTPGCSSVGSAHLGPGEPSTCSRNNEKEQRLSVGGGGGGGLTFVSGRHTELSGDVRDSLLPIAHSRLVSVMHRTP